MELDLWRLLNVPHPLPVHVCSADVEVELDGGKITQYRAMTKIYFDVEH